MARELLYGYTRSANWIMASCRDWLFSESPKSAGVYILIETAKANGFYPRKYIQYILSDIPETRFHEYPEYLEAYLPWNEYIQKICR